MKISLIQMNSQPDLDYNLRQARQLMHDAVERDRPDLIVLPEHFDWSGGTPQQKVEAADTVPGGRAYNMLQAFAASHRVWLHAGSILERIAGSNRIYNTTLVFDPDGREVGRYRKIHLFDIIAPDGKSYCESETVERGDELFIYEINGMRVGCAICYDLRFSRLFDRLTAAGTDVVILPAAFTLQTGKDHWEILCRARAIEFQVYFVACGQWGPYPATGGESRQTYGNSLVCDPWGQVVGRASDTVGFFTSYLDIDRVRKVRNLIPMEAHRVDFDDMKVRSARPECAS